jgi:hypothetical protein
VSVNQATSVSQATTSKDALAAYIAEIETIEAPAAAGGTAFNFFTWRALQILALAVALAGSVAAAMLGNESLREALAASESVLWILAIVLPLVSGALTAAISQTKVPELHLNRRRNYAKIRYLIDDGWAQFHAAKAEPEFASIHRALALEVEKVRGSWVE